MARGDGRDSDLLADFARLRRHLDAVAPDTLVIFDTHWITTGLHVVAGAARYAGRYTSSERPFTLARVAYDYPGAPELAAMVERVAIGREVRARNFADNSLMPQYATLDIVAKLRRDERVLSVGSCQTAKPRHYLELGAAIAEAVRHLPLRVALLPSGVRATPSTI